MSDIDYGAYELEEDDLNIEAAARELSKRINCKGCGNKLYFSCITCMTDARAIVAAALKGESQ